MKRKWIAIALSMIFLLLATSCAKDVPESEPSDTKKKVFLKNTEPAETEPEETVDFWVDLAVSGTANYTVVSARDDYDDMAKAFAESLSKKTGVTFLYKNKSVGGQKIIVGSDPDSVLDDPDDLTYAGLLGRYTDQHIYLTAHTKNGTQNAVNRFLSGILDEYVTEGADGKLNVRVPNTVFFLYNPTNYSNEKPTVFGESLLDYQIVFPAEMRTTERMMAKQIIDLLGNATGLKLSYVTDEAPEAEREIVVGKTNREASIALYESLSEGEYVIKSEGKSVYLGYENLLIATEARDRLCSILTRNVTEAISLSVTPNEAAALLQKKDPSHVRVMTSNALCAGDLDGVETYLKGMGVTWEERVGLQADMIMDYLPDFVGLQEMQESDNVNGYAGYMHTVMAAETAGEYTFVQYDEIPLEDYPIPILYRSTVWKLEDKGYSSFTYHAEHRHFWGLFSRLDDPSEQYILINLHNPTSNFMDEQLASAEAVHELFLDLEYLYPDVPIFIVGDFNAAIGSQTLSRIIIQTDLDASYRHTDDDGGQNFSGYIDLVLFQKNLVNVESIRVVRTHQIEKTSDHRPVFSDFSLK